MDNKPNYYSVLPAKVRYDNLLSPLAKLLFSEITALANKEGYCFASNDYFAKLYNVGPTWISKTITVLEEKKYIKTIVEARYNRKIYIDVVVLRQMGDSTKVQGGLHKSARGVCTKVQDNITSIIDKNNKKKKTDLNNQYLNSKNSIIACSDLELWELAVEMDVSLDDVKRTHESFFDYIERHPRKYKTVYKTIRNWIRMALQRGEMRNLNEMERMNLVKFENPEYIKKRKEIVKKAIKEGRL